MAMEGWGEEERINLSVLYSKVAFTLFFIGPEAILLCAHVVKVHFVAKINSAMTPEWCCSQSELEPPLWQILVKDTHFS